MNVVRERRLETESPDWVRLLSVSCLFLVARRAAAFGTEPKSIEEARIQSLLFLQMHRPQKDANLSQTFLQRNVDAALEARAAKPWAKQVPWDLFINDVLPYARYDLLYY
jgi:hypothetical protein